MSGVMTVRRTGNFFVVVGGVVWLGYFGYTNFFAWLFLIDIVNDE